MPAGTAEPDKFLFDKGNDALKAKKWLTAREYFKQVVETYTQSPYRPDAKLGVGDTYLGEGGADNLVLAINEFREFLSFYPDEPPRRLRAVQARHAHFRQMRAAAARSDRNARRDPRVPDLRRALSEQRADARGQGGCAKHTTGSARPTSRSGSSTYRQQVVSGLHRSVSTLLKNDPEYTSRDACTSTSPNRYVKIKREAQALPYYEKLVNEFPKSEHLQDAQKRIAELKAQAAKKS